MSILEASRTVWTSRMLSIFRVVAGLMLFTAGTMKVFGHPASPAPLPPFSPASLLGIAGMLEIVGGAAIILGVVTRPVAFVLSGEMAVAYFHDHFPRAFFPVTNMGMPAVLFCFFFLYLTFAGAGVWSIDALLVRKKWLATHAPQRVLEREPEPPTQPRKPARPELNRPVLYRG